jgi:hypothetical protein
VSAPLVLEKSEDRGDPEREEKHTLHSRYRLERETSESEQNKYIRCVIEKTEREQKRRSANLL